MRRNSTYKDLKFLGEGNQATISNDEWVAAWRQGEAAGLEYDAAHLDHCGFCEEPQRDDWQIWDCLGCKHYQGGGL